MNYFGIVVQLVTAICVIILFNKGAHKVMASQKVIVDHTRHISTYIFNGWVSGISFTNRKFNSFNDYAVNYRDMPRSVNRMGGTQFSFSIWTRFDDVSAMNLKNKVVFTYGDPTKYTVTRTIKEPDARGGGVTTETMADYIIKCPLLMFSEDGAGLNLQFNTNENIHNTVVIEKVRSTNESLRHNLMAMLPGKWALWTFVFREDVSKTGGADAESGIVVMMYVNEVLHHTEKVKGSLRLNKGFVTILPEPINHCMLADLTYHNWALTQLDVSNIVRRGVSNEAYTEMDDDAGFNSPNYITEYNKLEIYNL